MADADRWVNAWSKRLGAFAAETGQGIRQLLAQSIEDGLTTRTRARLNAVAAGLDGHRDGVERIFATAGVETTVGAGEADAGPSIVSYYSLIHRDWAWAPEVDEVSPAVDALVRVLPGGFELGNVLVLGAGTGRLAWELGNRLAGARTIIALDINPLPLLVTKRLQQGLSVSLFELPGHPRKSTLAAVERTLSAPTPPPPGLQLVLADGLNPPAANGAFDTVITPWFVDQVPENLALLPPIIRRVLRPGGSWLNQGPFVYDPARTKPAHRYCADEFIQIVTDAKFHITKATYEPQPHMASPLSSQGRTEWVLNMHATVKDLEPEAQTEPGWLTPAGADQVIQRLPGWGSYVAPHGSVAAVARLVDGVNTPRSIATLLVESGELADDGAALTAVIGCLRVIWLQLGQH